MTDHELAAYLANQTNRTDHMEARGKNLEFRAVSMIKQYGFFLPKPVKVFFHELADFLNWQNLKKEL